MVQDLKVLLVNPHYKAGGLDGLIVSPPLGLASIGAMVKDLCEVKLLDLKARHLNKGEIETEIKDYGPDLVGISMTMTPSTESALEIASLVRKQNNDTIVVAGGHHATFEADSLLKSENIDIVVRGEGEKTFRGLIEKILAKDKDLSSLKGLTYYRDGRIFQTPDRPYEEDLNELPSPDRNIYFHDNYPYHFFGLRVDSLETSRGCPFRCKFCSVQSFYKRTWRKYNEQRIIKEIDLIRKRGVKNVFIVDDNFTLDVNRVKNICSSIKRNSLNDLSFFCQARADVIANHPDMVEKMAEVGFSLVFLGIESPSIKILTDIQKNITLEQIKKSIRILRKNKIAVWGAYILGDIDETEDEVKRTIKFAITQDTDIAQFTVMTPLPGTEFFQEVGARLVTRDWKKFDFLNCVYKPRFLKPNEVEKWVIKAYKKFYLRARVVKRFITAKNKWIRSVKYCPWSYIKIFRVCLNKKP